MLLYNKGNLGKLSGTLKLAVPIMFILFSMVLGSSLGVAGTNSLEDELTARQATQTHKLLNAFEAMRSVGEASNAGVGAGTETARQACSALQDQGSRVLGDALKEAFYKNLITPSYLAGFEDTLISQGQSGLSQALRMSCAALRGEEAGGGANLFDTENLKRMGIALALDQGEHTIKSMAAPFVERIELETGYDDGVFMWEALTVVPLWENGKDHLFTQLSWLHDTEDGDTLNAGLAWRRLNENKTMVYGVNAFFDHAARKNHNRASIGADVQTSTLGLSTNKYIPLSSWKGLNVYQEERAASGWDLELQGRLPEFPEWQANLKGYGWSSNYEGWSEDILGYDTTLQWSPVNILQVEAGVRNEQSADPDYHAALRLVYRFGENVERAWDKPVRLASMEERVYDKVRRENKIRTERRTKDEFFVTVIESAGSNSANTEEGDIALSAGVGLPMPFTLNVSPLVGSIARLEFRDNALLTVGAGSQVRVEAKTITLLSGVLQYVSGTQNVTLAAPGATVTLLGTDVDLSTNGTTSVLRVRDGSAILAGTSSGNATLNAGEAAESVSGTVGTLISASAVYISHTDEISAKIDRVASALIGVKVAPYPAGAPVLTTQATASGETMTISLTFNDVVNVAGGPPQLTLDIGGITRTATLSGGSGSKTLTFNYTLVGADAGATSITVNGFNNNGATITGNGGKIAITTIADTVLGEGATLTETIALALDFVNNLFSLNGTSYGSFTAIPGATFSRATPATTYAEDSSGNLVAFAANTPRITDKGLLVEGTKENLALYSNDFNQTGWARFNVTALPNSTLAPDGTMSAYKIVENTTVGTQHWIARTGINVVSGQKYVISIFVKPAERTAFNMFGSGIFPQSAAFNLSTGTITSSSAPATIKPYANGWYRCTLLLTAGSTGSASAYVAQLNNPTGTYTGDGTSGLFIWGAQVEQASFASSYIPTAGASVTRSKDDPRITGMSILPDYTAYAEFEYRSESSRNSSRLLGLQPTAGRNAVSPLTSTTLAHTAFNTIDGNTAAANGINQSIRKLAGISTTSPQSRRIVADGGTVVGDGGFTPLTSVLFIGNENAGAANYIETYLRSLKIYPTAKTDAELQALTAP